MGEGSCYELNIAARHHASLPRLPHVVHCHLLLSCSSLYFPFGHAAYPYASSDSSAILPSRLTNFYIAVIELHRTGLLYAHRKNREHQLHGIAIETIAAATSTGQIVQDVNCSWLPNVLVAIDPAVSSQSVLCPRYSTNTSSRCRASFGLLVETARLYCMQNS